MSDEATEVVAAPALSQLEVGSEAWHAALEALVQGSPEWLLARCGAFTASCMHYLLPTQGEGKGLRAYIRAVAAERLSYPPQPQGFEGNEDTDFGQEQEPFARTAACEQYGWFIEQVGLVAHRALPVLRASPDGLERAQRFGMELKSHRKVSKFLEVVEAPIPRAHVIQCQTGMACTGFDRWFYFNWCPFMPEGQRLHRREVLRDEDMVAQIVVAARKADREVEAIVAKYRR